MFLWDLVGWSGQRVEQVAPVRVALFDKRELPGATPAFEALFMVDAVCDVVAAFRPDEAMQAVARAKVGAGAGAVLVDAGSEIGGDADIERAAIAVGHDVNPAAFMFTIHFVDFRRKRDPGSSPG